MNSATTCTITTLGSEGTRRLAALIARRLKGGEMVELVGDVGAGKTVFTQGLAQALGCTAEVTSPTFTVSRSYELPRGRRLHHFDFYRLVGHDMVTEALAEAVVEPDAITVVEWAEFGDAAAVLPADHLVLRFEYALDPDRRELSLTVPPALHYLIEGLASDYRAADRQ